MRRLLGIAVVLAAAAVLAVAGTGAGRSGGDPYLVRAIFDNAGFVIPGEDVKVAGVKVGSIDSLDVTEDKKAVVVLRIDNPGYQDFRADARCSVRPQSLIGERFVECRVTRPHAVGAPGAGPLERIARGPGKGQHLLPLANTSKSVDLDLLNNVMRLPYRQRFSIILNELGTGVAGRGQELRDVIRRADPALRDVDEVLGILATQNETLTRLAEDSDQALAPLARDRREVTGFIENSAKVAEATAERRQDLEADIERLPRLLAELTPTMDRLGEFSDQATPVLADLGARAPAVNAVLRQLGPFSQAGTPALETLGDAARVGRPALQDARPVVRDVRTFARDVRPVGRTLGQVLSSFRRTGGIERLMDLIFYQTTAINGYDRFGHYLRARLLVNNCSSYVVVPIGGCSAKFRAPEASSARASAAQPTPATTKGAETARSADAPAASPAGPAEAAVAASAKGAGSEAQTQMLDYLLGQEPR